MGWGEFEMGVGGMEVGWEEKRVCGGRMVGVEWECGGGVVWKVEREGDGVCLGWKVEGGMWGDDVG